MSAVKWAVYFRQAYTRSSNENFIIQHRPPLQLGPNVQRFMGLLPSILEANSLSSPTNGGQRSGRDHAIAIDHDPLFPSPLLLSLAFPRNRTTCYFAYNHRLAFALLRETIEGNFSPLFFFFLPNLPSTSNLHNNSCVRLIMLDGLLAYLP